MYDFKKRKEKSRYIILQNIRLNGYGRSSFYIKSMSFMWKTSCSFSRWFRALYYTRLKLFFMRGDLDKNTINTIMLITPIVYIEYMQTAQQLKHKCIACKAVIFGHREMCESCSAQYIALVLKESKA